MIKPSALSGIITTQVHQKEMTQMYIIFSRASNKAIRKWTYLKTSEQSTAYVRSVRDDLKVVYPTDELVVMTLPSDEQE